MALKTFEIHNTRYGFTWPVQAHSYKREGENFVFRGEPVPIPEQPGKYLPGIILQVHVASITEVKCL